MKYSPDSLVPSENESEPTFTADEMRIKAENGDMDAQLSYAFICLNGTHSAKLDSAEAMKWIEIAAHAGHDAGKTMAGHFLSGFLDSAELVEPNFAEASRWYQLAAEQGNRTAQFRMGELHLLGLGVIQNYVEAYKFFNLAAAQGREGAAEKRQQMKKQMTKEQIAE